MIKFNPDVHFHGAPCRKFGHTIRSIKHPTKCVTCVAMSRNKNESVRKISQPSQAVVSLLLYKRFAA